MTDKIHIFFNDIKLDLNVGYYDFEHGQTQPIILSLECVAPAAENYTILSNHNLDAVINYEPLHDYITKTLPQKNHQAFLEQIADDLCNYCLQNFNSEKVIVKIVKPTIFPDAPNMGITLTRYKKTDERKQT